MKKDDNMASFGSIYEQIDSLVANLEAKLLKLDLKEVQTIEELNAYLYDSEYKKDDFRLMKRLVENFDEETSIAFLDLMRQKMTESIVRILSAKK